MKIALVAQHATPLHPRAGSGPDRDDIGLTELTRRLAGQGNQVTVYAQKNHADLPDRADLDEGVRVEHIDVGAPAAPADAEPGDADLLERVPAFSGPLRSIWQSERPDVVHALAWTSGLAALAAARDLRIPVVQEFNSLGVTERRAAAVKPDGASAARIRLEPAIGRSASAVVATNSAEVADLTGLGVHRSSIRVVPWGVDTSLFAPEGPVARRNGRPRLLTASDLTQHQPLETLLRSADLVVSTCQY
ncbi:MAG: glycosyltransferase, partial [Actinobacteria bacterium]|nr:glycosyltransferase [Actinomycetota bacterium]